MEYVAPQADFSSVKTVNDEAWFLVFVAVLLALGATLVLGAAVWCLAYAHGKHFTGGVQWENGLKVNIECD
ncbi:hypothetical protein [Marininema halotolerans]|uniref:Uncharacterized protein n=1 Tax=Marininema halotolerans TaxID=1155944 RepID=A0A1I6U2U6_9BACL|nr:hypothetical protein [Marininema halotolerans]SFS95704.1 hypothetical protein SAMN05444972_11319 [Marininema halotolerans]